MAVKLFDGRRQTLKADASIPPQLSGTEIKHPVAIAVMVKVIAKTAEVPLAEPIAFTSSDVADAYGISVADAGKIIASLVQSSFLMEKADGQFGFKAGYVLGSAIRS